MKPNDAQLAHGGVGDIAVQLTDVTKAYGGVPAIRSMSLGVRRGEFFSFLGPSGCGKTTTLRAIAGLVDVDSGLIEIMGRDVTDLPPNKRNIGMVFQNYALFPHMTVAENVSFGLRMRRESKAAIRDRVEEALALVELAGAESRLPTQLSGGQQQRVALARAIVVEPQLLLLDEPLSNLDAKLRKTMQIELRALQRRLGITTIYVTHDQEEALTLSDRIAVMTGGTISQCAEPVDIYRHPSNRFVASFIGRVNLLSGSVQRRNDELLFHAEGGPVFRLPERLHSTAGDFSLAIRPENVQLNPTGETQGSGIRLPGRVLQVVYTGAATSYLLELEGGLQVMAEEQNITGAPRHHEGERVTLYIDPDTVYTVPEANHHGEFTALEHRVAYIPDAVTD